MSDTGDIVLEKSNSGIWTFLVENPRKRNALNLEMFEKLGKLAFEAESDAGCRVVVIRGAGNVSFCSGADIAQLDQDRNSLAKRMEYDKRSGRMLEGLKALTKPVIAAIDGHCIGGGMMLAMFTDFRIATQKSTFGIPAARLGVAYEISALRRLRDLVGHAEASWIMFAAEIFGAEQALANGFVRDLVCDDDELDKHVEILASRICSNAPLTISASKAALNEDTIGPPISNIATTLFDRCFDSEDYAEGRAAFLEKRSPRFYGK